MSNELLAKKTPGMMRLILLGISLLIVFQNAKAQSNDYFNQNESWASVHFGIPGYPLHNYHTYQTGNTIVGSESLIKLIQAHAYEGMPADTNYFLAKSNSGKLYLYVTNSNFVTIGDSTIFDYSRSDSITKHTYINSILNYEAWQIISIDTIYFGLIARKVFKIEPYPNCFVYEGVPGFFINSFENTNLLKCYSNSGTSYDVDYNSFTANSTGNCIIENLGLNEIYSNEKTLVKIVDMMGRESIEKNNIILIYIYSDGTTEKVFSVE